MSITASEAASIIRDHVPTESDGAMYGSQWSCGAENQGRACTFTADRSDVLEWAEHLIQSLRNAQEPPLDLEQ